MDLSSRSVPAGVADVRAVIDVTEATFATEVVERSRRTPVVLDLWAEWCAPCRQLSPVLERLAGEAQGAWVLAKVDVDANPRLAEALQVQGIPAVKAVIDGRLVGEFTGALPEAEVRAWLAEIGIGTAGAPPTDPRLVEAMRAERAGDLAAAAAAYRAVLDAQPGDAAARTGAARVDLLLRVAASDPDQVRARAAAAPDDPEAAAAVADVEFAAGDVDAAFERLLALVGRSAGERREAARRHLVALFDLLPADDPRVVRARRRLAAALF